MPLTKRELCDKIYIKMSAAAMHVFYRKQHGRDRKVWYYIMVQIEMQDGGVITLELDSSAAPKTVENFKELAKSGFYNGLIFHRVIKDFMIQGGDPTGSGIGGAPNNVVGEFAMNGHKNPISHVRGVISMARAQNPDSASSQFFIVHRDSTYLDGSYAAFGHVTDGMDVVDRIASTPTDMRDRPVETQTIKEIRVIGE